MRNENAKRFSFLIGWFLVAAYWAQLSLARVVKNKFTLC